MARERVTQAQRRARSRAALLEATARRISRTGYGALRLEDVARDAGYTRGAVYHQFADRDALVLETLEWVRESWYEEVGSVFDEPLAPAEALVELARRHAIYCRRDVAGVMIALRVELAGRDHPIAAAVLDQVRVLTERTAALVARGRRDGSIAPGPPARVLAGATLAAVEAAVVAMAGRPGDDVEVAQRVVRGLLAPAPAVTAWP